MSRRLSRAILVVGALALAGGAGMVLAQGNGVSTPNYFSGGSFEVSGVQVDVSAKTADLARTDGWRLAQRKGWEMLSKRLTGSAASIGDGTLDSLVTGIVVEQEEIGPTRYIARLGVLFDRGRAASLLGVAAQFRRSPPMLLIPVMVSGGVARAFERETPWQKAWGRFRAGSSSVDYVRPTGTGPDAMLLNYGQTQRNGRGWWRDILDQYGARDVLVPEVRLRREWPGGPIVGTFIASHGPDGERIAQFSLRVSSADALDALLDAGVKRIDQAYQDALAGGSLGTDPYLAVHPVAAPAPEDDSVADNVVAPVPMEEETPPLVPLATASQTIAVQVDTPSAGSVSAAEGALRGIPGVRAALTTSLALGGVSVVRVTFDGDTPGLRAALEARGWQVQEGAGTLRIRRAAAPTPPAAPAGEGPGGA